MGILKSKSIVYGMFIRSRGIREWCNMRALRVKFNQPLVYTSPACVGSFARPVYFEPTWFYYKIKLKFVMHFALKLRGEGGQNTL